MGDCAPSLCVSIPRNWILNLWDAILIALCCRGCQSESILVAKMVNSTPLLMRGPCSTRPSRLSQASVYSAMDFGFAISYRVRKQRMSLRLPDAERFQRRAIQEWELRYWLSHLRCFCRWLPYA